jgi:hypothetical protein
VCLVASNRGTYISNPLWVVLKKFLKCSELLDDPFDRVELVPPNDDLLALIERTQGLELWLDARTLPNNSSQVSDSVMIK